GGDAEGVVVVEGEGAAVVGDDRAAVERDVGGRVEVNAAAEVLHLRGVLQDHRTDRAGELQRSGGAVDGDDVVAAAGAVDGAAVEGVDAPRAVDDDALAERLQHSGVAVLGEVADGERSAGELQDGVG